MLKVALQVLDRGLLVLDLSDRVLENDRPTAEWPLAPRRAAGAPVGVVRQGVERLRNPSRFGVQPECHSGRQLREIRIQGFEQGVRRAFKMAVSAQQPQTFDNNISREISSRTRTDGVTRPHSRSTSSRGNICIRVPQRVQMFVAPSTVGKTLETLSKRRVEIVDGARRHGLTPWGTMHRSSSRRRPRARRSCGHTSSLTRSRQSQGTRGRRS